MSKKKLPTEQTKIKLSITLSRELNNKLDNIAEIKTAKRNLPKAQRKLPNLQTEYELMLQNMKDNEQEIIHANITNKAVAKKYEDAFNALNQNMYSVKQEPHESELDYIRRQIIIIQMCQVTPLQLQEAEQVVRLS